MQLLATGKRTRQAIPRTPGASSPFDAADNSGRLHTVVCTCIQGLLVDYSRDFIARCQGLLSAEAKPSRLERS
jgi:hypothetical protein